VPSCERVYVFGSLCIEYVSSLKILDQMNLLSNEKWFRSMI
jgi:hypothetical protein